MLMRMDTFGHRGHRRAVACFFDGGTGFGKEASTTMGWPAVVIVEPSIVPVTPGVSHTSVAWRPLTSTSHVPSSSASDTSAWPFFLRIVGLPDRPKVSTGGFPHAFRWNL